MAVNDPQYSDVIFEVQGSQVFAHKAILKARSSYFFRLFESDFKEKELSVFPIENDISVPVFLAFLTYLYTGNESIITEENAVELLRVTDRFMMDDFQQLVEAYIIQSVELDNVAWLLEISDRYRAPRLKRVCLELICESTRENLEAILNSSGFIDLRFSSPHLLRELDYKASKSNMTKPGEVMHFKPLPANCHSISTVVSSPIQV